jgi:hypothetical protein
MTYRGQPEQDRSDQAQRKGGGVVVDGDPSFSIGDRILFVERAFVLSV